VSSRKIISTKAGKIRWSPKNKILHTTFKKAFNPKSAKIRDLYGPFLFQTMRAEIVVRMKIVFQAIGNAQSGGVRDGLTISASYHSIPPCVTQLPTIATRIVMEGMTK